MFDEDDFLDYYSAREYLSESDDEWDDEKDFFLWKTSDGTIWWLPSEPR